MGSKNIHIKGTIRRSHGAMIALGIIAAGIMAVARGSVAGQIVAPERFRSGPFCGKVSRGITRLFRLMYVMGESPPDTQPLAIGLLVDGAELFVSVVQRVLRRRRIEITAATNADSALRLAAVPRLDFALVDLQISSNSKLVELFQQHYPAARLILMTDRDGMRSDNWAGGCPVSYLPKAMSLEVLLQALAIDN